MNPQAIHPSKISKVFPGDHLFSPNVAAVTPATAWTTIAVTADGGGFDSPGRSMGSRTPAVEADTQQGHQFGHVPHQIIVDFCVINDHHAATVGVEDSGDAPGSEPDKAIPVLDDDDAHRRIGEQYQELAALTVECRPDLGHHQIDPPYSTQHNYSLA